MIDLLDRSTEALLGNFKDRFDAWIINLVMEVISNLEKLGSGFFDSAIVKQTLSFTAWLTWLVFGVAFIILLLDIAEEAGGYKPGQSLEVATVFSNFIKALIFILMGPNMAVIGIQLATTMTGQLSVNYTDLRNEIPNVATFDLAGGLILIIVLLIALIGFFCFTLFSVGGVFIQAATAFLYVPDILRGRSTAMGDWIRQTVSIMITFLFRHILFIIGLTGALNHDFITMCAGWIAMFGTAKLLQKFGMSSGFGGMVSRTAQMGQSAAYMMMTFGR